MPTMATPNLSLRLALAAAVLVGAGLRADAEEVSVLSAVGMRQVLLALGPQFERLAGVAVRGRAR